MQSLARLVLTFAIAGLATVAIDSPSRASTNVAATSGAPPVAALDIEIAIDGTASMAPAIEQTTRDALSIVEGVRGLVQDTHFAVVVFRDFKNPGGEYELLQPMTGNAELVRSALARVRAVRNPTDSARAESYNLAFRRSYEDPAVGWRTGSRKVVVVIGDAEPHGAGRSGLPGCTDTTRDPHGLDTAAELANMRKAGRTLLMVRQVSAETSASLSCHESLAARAAPGGAAVDSGAGSLTTTIVALVQRAYVPVSVRPDLRVALPGGSLGYTVTVTNPNPSPLRLESLSLSLPDRARSDRASVANDPGRKGRNLLPTSSVTVLAPAERLVVHVVVRLPKRAGTHWAAAIARASTVTGERFVSRSSREPVRVVTRLRHVAFGFSARAAGTSARGSARAALRTASRRPTWTGIRTAGSVVVRSSHGQVLLRPVALRLLRVGSPSLAVVRLTVARGGGFVGCRPGTRAELWLVFSRRRTTNGAVTANGVDIRLPSRCGGRLRASSSGSTAAWVAVR